MAVYSIYVEKKPPFAVEAATVLQELRTALQMTELQGVRIVSRYFVENITPEEFAAARDTVFSEPPVDLVYDTLPEAPGSAVFAVELLPGQFDQRADSCAQCLAFQTGKERPAVRCAKIYYLEGSLTKHQVLAVKYYLINPVERRETPFDVPETLAMQVEAPGTIERLQGFIHLDQKALATLHGQLGLAMDLEDLLFCQNYFAKEENRDPSITEIRMIDTYWSDHCRHTTFLTELDEVEIESDYIRNTYKKYQQLRSQLYADKVKPETLMDLATIGAKELRRQGMLNRLDESEEINACSVNVRILVDGKPQDWLLMFKNETHNHPTEIEPFGGASTCLGGAIRDPLSGRSYVYQAMRIVGAGNPLVPVDETISGKLPQRTLAQTAAAGYSSYGNQIGLAAGQVHEIYHPGYIAKRMELGAVVGAAQADAVVRETPIPGDVVILLGGLTGRDGCGGATGSSKSHTIESLESCGAEVQKGNAPEERKIQRLFRDREVMAMIKRCNDFGAGGVSVSIGELADGLHINLDTVPTKYDGLDGTELAISESQERMSVVVAAEHADRFIEFAEAENLQATVVATVTESPRLVMDWQGDTIVDLSRSFLNSNGAAKHAKAHISAATMPMRHSERPLTEQGLEEMVESLGFCSQKGVMERFDATSGSATVLLPYGGKYQATPAQVMAAKFPVLAGETNACSLMAWGFDPYFSEVSPYHGAVYAVVHSIAKLIATGGSRHKCWLTFQEYFERLGDDPKRWGKPAAALLGALEAQLQLQIASIGGKDSMSGSFENLDVPPTLVSFAVGTAQTDNIISNEFKQVGSPVYLLHVDIHHEDSMPHFKGLRVTFDMLEELISSGAVLSAWAVGAGGTAEAIFKMSMGNRIGFAATQPLSDMPSYGSFVIEAARPIPQLEARLLGCTTEDFVLRNAGEEINLVTLAERWEEKMEPVYPRRAQAAATPDAFAFDAGGTCVKAPAIIEAKPLAAIPVFPGANCEYETARAFEKAGVKTETLIIRNLTGDAIIESVEKLAQLLDRSQILVLPGGMTGGDEPDGSAKLITAFMRRPKVAEAFQALLQERGGLALGIGNGFQALIKLGLVPFGDLRDLSPDSPALADNLIGRHQAGMVRTRVASNKSPWLCHYKVGDVFTLPISYAQGRFAAEEAFIQKLAQNGQIATQYVDFDGNPSGDVLHNPSGSVHAIEGITSPDGRILGKMAHNERWAEDLYRNLPDVPYMDIFSGAARYYK